MTASLLLRSPLIVGDAARPAFVKDPLVRPGTKFLYDFTDPRCHPNGEITAGAIPTGAVFNDLASGVDAVAPASFGSVLSSGAIQVNTAGSALFAIGSAGQFDMNGKEFVALLWLKLPTTYTTSSFRPLFYLGPDDVVNNAQFRFDTDSTGGLLPRALVATGSASKGASVASALTVETVTQLALHYKPGERVDLYRNGALSTSVTNSVPSTLASAASAVARFSNRILGTFYRLGLVDITASIEAEQDMGFSADKILTAAQYIARDYAFCTDALAAAPKTAFT